MALLFVVLSAFILATLLTHITVAAISNDWSDFYFATSSSHFPKTHLQMWSCIAVISGIALAGFLFDDFTIMAALLSAAVGLPYALFQWKVIVRKLKSVWRR